MSELWLNQTCSPNFGCAAADLQGTKFGRLLLDCFLFGGRPFSPFGLKKITQPPPFQRLFTHARTTMCIVVTGAVFP
jgi:hypothetical protein